MRTVSRMLAVLSATATLAATAVGCAEVKPWERGPLTHRCMRAVPQASRGMLREHVMAVREGAAGGLGGAGAGCGCD